MLHFLFDLLILFIYIRRRATVHESLKHSWICFNDEITLSNEQIIDEEEEEEPDELTNEINN